MQKPSSKRDQYFLELHDKAYARVVARGVKIIGADDIAEELKPLLVHELSYSDFNVDKIGLMYKASEELDLTLARPLLTATASDEERYARGEYDQKFSAIQNILVNYLLGEDYEPNPTMALHHWEVARLTSVCENYKRELCQINAPYTNIKHKKLHEINKLLAILTDKSTHSDDKIPAFTKQYEKHKSTLAGNKLEFDTGLHTHKLFKASQKNTRLLSFSLDISHILAQVQKAVLSIIKQCHSHIKQEQSVQDIDKIVRHF
tara:strand:+ start:226 stop:1008 length:783 start_codon:yes stop_codon:yes gene_type:complete